jgi:hypothetical protein
MNPDSMSCPDAEWWSAPSLHAPCPPHGGLLVVLVRPELALGAVGDARAILARISSSRKKSYISTSVAPGLASLVGRLVGKHEKRASVIWSDTP